MREGPESEILANAVDLLLEKRNAAGHWEGKLSSSALSTANAIVALHCVDAQKYEQEIFGGVSWLETHQNADGGWGDTTLSFSNISTTLLCWAALKKTRPHSPAILPAEYWIRDYIGSLTPTKIAEAVKARYGNDRTFSVPILMLCSICGTLGKNGWRYVLPLPFELAAFPRKYFATLRLPVVSYALPALIAIGFARWRLAPPSLFNPLRWIRRSLWPRVSQLLEEIQPSSGGFLEAAPLTGFVTMALASAGESSHPVAQRGVRFLLDSIRPDGSWPIDTNLSTWATTLSTKALLAPSISQTKQGIVRDLTLLNEEEREKIQSWLLHQQYREIHPFTNSPPGGWAWTDLPGGVPDADDTPGALLALHYLSSETKNEPFSSAIAAGITWLLDLQNRDGGIPTFCKGWGALPFDRSSPDLTAHCLRAWSVWYPELPDPLQNRIESATLAACLYLLAGQESDGSWHPLWFGNQYRSRDECNPTYGTAHVCIALHELKIPHGETQAMDAALTRGLSWIRQNQNPDGGWGSGENSPSSIEETALALRALPSSTDTNILKKAVAWLREATQEGTHFPPSPIGFYFAKLWYYEEIYPIVWTVDALRSHDQTWQQQRSAATTTE